jgi:signal transduction histidine kinase
LFRVIEEHVGVLVELHLSERLADLIDGAISAAVKSYVASRDYDARRREAEHIGFITHELRNPLATALLGAQRLQRGGDIRAKEQRTLQLMERNLLRISELIDAVLVMERHTHSFKPTISTTTLGDLIEEVVENGRLAAESKGLSFVSHFDANIAVNVDAKLAHSAIDNVIQNAVKYTDSGEVRVTADDGPKEVVIHVCDHCSGIPPQEMAMLFEPFRRASHKPGTGLGLAIAKRALEVQGGAIGVEPAQDGCHFWVKLRKPTH